MTAKSYMLSRFAPSSTGMYRSTSSSFIVKLIMNMLLLKTLESLACFGQHVKNFNTVGFVICILARGAAVEDLFCCKG